MRFTSKSLRWLRICEASTIMLLIASPLFFREEILFYAISFSGGIIAGAEFVAANHFLNPPFYKGGQKGIIGCSQGCREALCPRPYRLFPRRIFDYDISGAFVRDSKYTPVCGIIKIDITCSAFFC